MVALEKTLESPLDCKEIQPVHPEGYQSWVFIGRTDVEAETSILCPPEVKSWLIWKHPDAGKDWGQEKGTTEDEMVGWHHRLNGHGFGWTLGVGDGQGGLACCSSWGHKESDTTEKLNWNDVLCLYLNHLLSFLPFFHTVFIWCTSTHFPGFSLEAAFHVTMFPVPQSWLTVPAAGLARTLLPALLIKTILLYLSKPFILVCIICP